MTAKKNTRTDGTYLISTDSTHNPKLCARMQKDGRSRLFLDYYFGAKKVVTAAGAVHTKKARKKESLNIYIIESPRTPIEREENRQAIELAQRIRRNKEREMTEAAEGYKYRDRKADILEFMRGYVESYKNKDVRNIKGAYVNFTEFLRGSGVVGEMLRAQQLSAEMVEDFADYLQGKYKGEGPLTKFKSFKKMLRAAVKAGILAKSPAEGITITIDRYTQKKEVLSEEEIIKLSATHYEGENANIRRAFLFAVNTGVRFCDVKGLTFENVDFPNRTLRFEQAKTKGRSAKSGVICFLNDEAFEIVGRQRENSETRKDLIFPLPSANAVNKALKHWTKRAGIEKRITFHCARHTFGTLLVGNGASLTDVSNLMGHSSTQQTEIYLRAVDKRKRAAVDSLPRLNKETL